MTNNNTRELIFNPKITLLPNFRDPSSELTTNHFRLLVSVNILYKAEILALYSRFLATSVIAILIAITNNPNPM